MTETADGNTRALQPQELYKTQQYATAVYRSELAERLRGMGYEIERGEHGQPEIKGYSREYLEASSHMHTFVERLKGNDRVLFVGDTRQHEAVEAGKPYAQLQDAGMKTAKRSPESTLAVSPDNESRREINGSIHRAMQDAARSKLRSTGEYARVERTGRENNTVTVTRKNGEELSYEPRRLQGVTVYRETERTFAEIDRVQMTAPHYAEKLANRELGMVEKIDARRAAVQPHGSCLRLAGAVRCVDVHERREDAGLAAQPERVSSVRPPVADADPADGDATADADPVGHGADDQTAAGGHGTLAGLEHGPLTRRYLPLRRP